MVIETIKWSNGAVKIIDQTKLPQKLEYLHCRDIKTLWHAIRVLKVRGAPALGVAAAFGVLLGLKNFKASGRNQKQSWLMHFAKVCDYLATSRPTAVNLFNALDDMLNIVLENKDASIGELEQLLKCKAFEIYETDRRVCRMMGDYGSRLIKNNGTILTVCNAGALATVDYGTALGVMYSAKKNGKKFKVYACETRPLLQGARLTAWELQRSKIDVTLICDNMAASLMQKGKVDAVFAGADRIARNGDAANKIGTYMLAVLAKYHKVPFYIVAPRSTFDLKIKTGKDIPIEERNPQEVLTCLGKPVAPRRVKVYNPAFDVTPYKLISGIVTEQGILRPPYLRNIQRIST